MTSIEQHERDVWPDPGPEATSLVRRCAELRRKPLAEFTVEDLRVMIGQEIGVPALLPLALQVLRRDPLVEGDYYPGDLLANVLRLPESAGRACEPNGSDCALFWPNSSPVARSPTRTLNLASRTGTCATPSWGSSVDESGGDHLPPRCSGGIIDPCL
ncbi:contact-dependent growth inhibition system immunity protein [Micromonospora tulbaghiae]|uniref:contact-dependent growth inhibition system immunity protein n=1 Tax=Micromonospora tulbaghiae TaxID=479978 RepID=UPI0036466778